MPNPNSNSNKTRRLGGQGRLDRMIIPGSARASNPSQIVQRMVLQGPPTKVTSQASTGLIVVNVNPSLSALTNASSFKTVYDEWRLTAIEFQLTPLGANGGSTKFILDDEDAIVPTLAFANARRGTLLSNSNASKNYHRLSYRCEDIDDLKFISCTNSSTYSPVSLKIYSDLSTYVTQPSTDEWLITWEGHFEFRGVGAAN